MDALYRLEMKRKSRGPGRDTDGMRAYRQGTIVAAAAYRRGEHGYVMEDGHRRHHDYRHKRGIAYVELLCPAGVADFARDSKTLWPEVKRVERRKDALLAHEILITLPRHAPLPICIEHLRAWIQIECVDKGMVADLAIHAYGSPLDPKHPEQAKAIAELRAAGIPIYPLQEGDLLRGMPPGHHHAWELPDGKILPFQPHAHILLTTRDIGPDGFGLKVKEWGQKAQLYRWRQSWERTCNAILAEAGRPERVSAQGRWKEASASEMSDGRHAESGPISRAMTQSIEIGGGHRAGLEGRPPKQGDATAEMTKFDFNQRVRALHKSEAAVQAEREAAAHEQEQLIEAIARVQQLADEGIHLDLDDEAGLLVEEGAARLSDADARLLARHRTALAKVFATAPGRAPQVDEALGEAMALVDSLQRDHGITFHRTQKGSLGYEPEGAVAPEIYRKFSGMHDAILAELDRRRYAQLLARGRARLQQQQVQLEEAAQQTRKLQQTLAAEREQHHRLEAGARDLFESADTGKPLPETIGGHPLLETARRILFAHRAKMNAEKERADAAERAVEALKKTVAMLWGSVDHLVRGLGWIASKAIRKHPDLKEELSEDYRTILVQLPEEVRSQIEIRRVPGLSTVHRTPAHGRNDAARPQAIPTGTAPAVGKDAWTLPDELRSGHRPEESRAVPPPAAGTLAPDARPAKKQPER